MGFGDGEFALIVHLLDSGADHVGAEGADSPPGKELSPLSSIGGGDDPGLGYGNRCHLFKGDAGRERGGVREVEGGVGLDFRRGRRRGGSDGFYICLSVGTK